MSVLLGDCDIVKFVTACLSIWVSLSGLSQRPSFPQFDDKDSLNDRLDILFNSFDNDDSGSHDHRHPFR